MPLRLPSFIKKQVDSKLLKVILVSVLLHIVLGLILGGITIAEYIAKDDSAFQAPEEMPSETPPEHKITITPKTPKLQLPDASRKPVNDISVSPLNVDLPVMSDSFTISNALTSNSQRNFTMGGLAGARINRLPDIKGFGTTKKLDHAWKGTVYLFKEGEIIQLLDADSKEIEGLKKGKRQTSKIYNFSLNVPSQNFEKGFPGISDQFEWFAINFETRIQWPAELAGEYEFRLTSDDGSVLFIDRKLIVNNDGMHDMQAATGIYTIKSGFRRLQVAYFQGPAFQLGLILEYRKSGSTDWKVFDLKELLQYQSN